MERVLSVDIRITVDTNKQTYTYEFDTFGDAEEFIVNQLQQGYE